MTRRSAVDDGGAADSSSSLENDLGSCFTGGSLEHRPCWFPSDFLGSWPPRFGALAKTRPDRRARQNHAALRCEDPIRQGVSPRRRARQQERGRPSPSAKEESDHDPARDPRAEAELRPNGVRPGRPPDLPVRPRLHVLALPLRHVVRVQQDQARRQVGPWTRSLS
jgi:hypothetical protein